MAMATKCEVCLSVAGCEFKEIFTDENRHIVGIVAKHLWFELAETPESRWLCSKCWNALEEFHTFYCEIETARRRQASPAQIDKEEDDEEDVSDPTAPTSDDEALHGNGSDCSSGDSGGRLEKKSKKLHHIDEEAKQTKAIAQKQEDESLHSFYKRIVCEVCDNQRMMVGEPQIDFGTWRALLRHTKEVHRHDKVYVKCPLCELKLRTKQTLLQHKDCHENPEKYRCMLCAEIHQNMKEHLQNKHQERQFCCDVCGKKFPFKKRLTVHMKKMHVEKDIICDQCQK
uniref:C2H2-type domain-containing protein n=1 Tax=Anopheles maculatus TaxID=74869 RepID=A0A182T6H4_9DIPT